jgi:hypothetical protein
MRLSRRCLFDIWILETKMFGEISREVDDEGSLPQRDGHH